MEQRIPVILFARDSSVQCGRRVVQTITLSWRSSVCRRNREEQNEHPGRPSRKGSPGIDDKGLHRPFVAFGKVASECSRYYVLSGQLNFGHV
jgi:hypothetical protein